MSGIAARVGRLTALWLLAAALAPVGWISIAAADTGPETRLRPPALLWKSFPLEQQPSTTGRDSVPAARQRPAEATPPAAKPGSPEVQPLRTLLIVSALLATLVAMATILLLQSSVPARVGGFRRARVGAMPPRRTRRPRAVTGRPVADPHEQPTQPAVSEPGDDLLDALRPTSPSAPAPALVPEQAAARDRRREPPLELPLRRLVEVPEPDQDGTTQEGPAPHWRGARQARPSVESCEIRLWRGYLKCRLYASVHGSQQAFAMSPMFRLRDKDGPSARAQGALADLLVELERRGWTVVSDGPTWYEHRLQRVVTTPLDGLEIGPT